MTTPHNAPYKVEQRKWRQRAAQVTLAYAPHGQGPAKAYMVNGETRYRPWKAGELTAHNKARYALSKDSE